MPTPMPNIVVVGDFNLPNFNWEDSQSDCLISNIMCPFVDSLFLKQVVTKPTRGNNILDLVFCHDDLVDSIDISKTSISDHCILHINSSIPALDKQQSSILNPPTSLMASLNKCSWDLINASLHGTDWQKLLTDLSTIDCFNTFMETVSRICQSVVPLYKKAVMSYLEVLQRKKDFDEKRAKLKKRLICCPGSLNLENLILSIESDILNSHISERLHEEEMAISKIKSDSNFFFRFAKKFSITNQDIGPFYNGQGDHIILVDGSLFFLMGVDENIFFGGEGKVMGLFIFVGVIIFF